MAVVGIAPCQCFSPGENQITSPGRISSTGPLQRCAQPQPAVTTRVCPSGWVCQAVRAAGSKVTLAPKTRAGEGALKSGSMRTEPVKYSAGPLPEGCEPLRVMLILCESSFEATRGAPDPEAALALFAWTDAEASRKSDMTVAASSFISVLLSIHCLMVGILPLQTGAVVGIEMTTLCVFVRRYIASLSPRQFSQLGLPPYYVPLVKSEV